MDSRPQKTTSCRRQRLRCRQAHQIAAPSEARLARAQIVAVIGLPLARLATAPSLLDRTPVTRPGATSQILEGPGGGAKAQPLLAWSATTPIRTTMIRAPSGDPGSRRSGAIGPCAGSTSVLGTLNLNSVGKGRLALSRTICLAEGGQWLHWGRRRPRCASRGKHRLFKPASIDFKPKRRDRRESMQRSDAVLPSCNKP
jgi:hypothetical protein